MTHGGDERAKPLADGHGRDLWKRFANGAVFGDLSVVSLGRNSAVLMILRWIWFDEVGSWSWMQCCLSLF